MSSAAAVAGAPKGFAGLLLPSTLGPAGDAKLDSPPDFAPPKPPPKPLPKVPPPNDPKPDLPDAANGEAPRPELGEAKLPSLGASDVASAPKPEEDVLDDDPSAPKGDFSELANAAKPDDANAEVDVSGDLDFSVLFDVDGGLSPEDGFAVARLANGETEEVLAKPLFADS